MRYIATAVIALLLGFSFLGFQYWWYLPGYLPDPPAPVIHALYWPVWTDHPITVRASECGIEDGIFYFKALDHPTGWAYLSLHRQIYYGLCLDDEVPDSVLGDGPMRFN